MYIRYGTQKTWLIFRTCNTKKWYFVSKFFLTYCEKKIFWKKNFWNSKLPNFWDYWNNLYEQWKVSTIFEGRMFFKIIPGGSLRLEQLEFKLEKIIGMLKHAEKVSNGILFTKLSWPSVRKKCSSDQEKNVWNSR